MKYNKYIENIVPVSEIGFGAWQLGHLSGWKRMAENEALMLVHRAIELGINFFDTAPNYGLGTSEERLGKALKNQDRSKLVINTKFGHSVKGSLDFDSTCIRESLEGSLRRLQTDYVDSLVLHNPPKEILDGNQTDHFEVLEKLKEEGKIRAYGASVDTFEEMNLLMNTTESTIIEVFFNILHQDTARGFEKAKEKNIALIAKIPLDSGWLTGKYNEESSFNDIRSRWSGKDIQTRAQLVDKVKEIVGPDEILSQKALSFCLSYDSVATVIPGNTTITQLEKNVKSTQNPISKDTVKKLEELYESEIKDLQLPW